MLHIAKLAVGIRDIDHLQQAQAARLVADPPLRHLTRNLPRRAAEITDGGSLYWVIAGAMLVRQRVLDIIETQWDDGSRCAGLMLDPALVAVAGRRTKPFQGWRYLAATDAPADIESSPAVDGLQALPERMQRDLRALCLL